MDDWVQVHLRRILTGEKFAASQPRDDSGRWTSGGFTLGGETPSEADWRRPYTTELGDGARSLGISLTDNKFPRSRGGQPRELQVMKESEDSIVLSMGDTNQNRMLKTVVDEALNPYSYLTGKEQKSEFWRDGIRINKEQTDWLGIPARRFYPGELIKLTKYKDPRPKK